VEAHLQAETRRAEGIDSGTQYSSPPSKLQAAAATVTAVLILCRLQRRRIAITPLVLAPWFEYGKQQV
jgi:hypothetical protein